MSGEYGNIAIHREQPAQRRAQILNAAVFEIRHSDSAASEKHVSGDHQLISSRVKAYAAGRVPRSRNSDKLTISKPDPLTVTEHGIRSAENTAIAKQIGNIALHLREQCRVFGTDNEA